MRILRTVLGVTTFAAAAYGTYAALTFLSYGRRKRVRPSPSLDRFIPDPEVIEQHRIWVDAPAAVTYQAACAYDMGSSRLAHLLFDTRALVMGVKPLPYEPPKHFIDAMKQVGWATLDEQPGKEIVFGALAQPWMADAAFRTIPPAEFVAFNEPGYVKIVLNVSVESSGLLQTETRVVTTDGQSRKRFRKYWAFVNPGVKLIRLELLRGIKSAAEAAAETAAA